MAGSNTAEKPSVDSNVVLHSPIRDFPTTNSPGSIPRRRRDRLETLPHEMLYPPQKAGSGLVFCIDNMA